MLINKSGGEKMKNYLLVGMMALVLAIVVVQSFQISAMKGQIAGNAAAVSANSGGAIDTTGWTDDEKMQYEHHGLLPQRLQQASKTAAQSSQPASMVGGC